MERDRLHRWAGWAGLALACAGFAVLNVVGWFPARRASGIYQLGWKQALIWELVRWELWVPIAALILQWVKRFPARRGQAVRNLLRTAATGVLFSASHCVLLVGIYFPLTGGNFGAFLQYRSFVFLTEFLTGLIVTGLILGLARARDYQLQLRGEELHTSRLESQLAQAQLDALKMQLHPHFLFNTLNAISSLQLEKPEAAQRMLVRLSEFLRLTLEAPEQSVTLRRETDFVTRYLEIERIRFPDKLSVRFDLAPETLGAMVPNLILQPVVENAVRHGIAAKTEPGSIEVSSARRNGFLHLQVRDSGPGMASRHTNSRDDDSPSPGIGLANIRGRLERLYGESFRFSVEDADGGGVLATIEIPFQEAGETK